MTILESMNANIPLLLRDLPEYKPILFDYYLKANSQQTFKDELTKLKKTPIITQKPAKVQNAANNSIQKKVF